MEEKERSNLANTAQERRDGGGREEEKIKLKSRTENRLERERRRNVHRNEEW